MTVGVLLLPVLRQDREDDCLSVRVKEREASPRSALHSDVRKANRLRHERESVLRRWGEQALVLCGGPGLFFVRTL